ncbi:hypothetical protein ACQJBY_034611 [Aegilops geniculata]
MVHLSTARATLAYIYAPPLLVDTVRTSQPAGEGMSGSGSGSGVWVFKNGVMQLQPEQPAAGRKALLYVPTGERMATLELLERRLGAHGWERYYENRDIVQLHRRDGGIDLISLPRDFTKFRSTHMYDVVLKNRDSFKVVDVPS